MKRFFYVFIVSAFISVLLACGKVKNKASNIVQQVKTKTKNELKEQSKKIKEKVFPSFDYDKPDTENNKKRFDDFLKIERTSDVKNIYCFDDTIGIDADYMFSFNCNEKTSKKIIAKHFLTLDKVSTDNAFGIQYDFDWWDKNRIKKLQKYSWTDGRKYHKYYWYDDENEKAYFFDFTI